MGTLRAGSILGIREVQSEATKNANAKHKARGSEATENASAKPEGAKRPIRCAGMNAANVGTCIPYSGKTIFSLTFITAIKKVNGPFFFLTSSSSLVPISSVRCCEWAIFNELGNMEDMT